MKKIKLYNKISNKGLDRFPVDAYEVGEQLEGEDAILVRSAKLHDVEFPSTLKAIARAGAGTNNIPIDVCSEKGIVVFNTPGANANAVKELVFAGLLMASRPSFEGMNWIQGLTATDDVATKVEKEKSRFVGHELHGKTLGVIGLGAIGIKVANLALHFGMDVYGYDPYISVQAAWNLSRNVIHAKNVDEIYKNCDFITIHVPLNDKTKHMIDGEAIAKMKKNAFILNFARGGLVDEDAVCVALEKEHLQGYVTDFPNEKLIGNPKVYCIPHLGASTDESEENCAIMAVDQLKDYLENGNIVNSVNLPNVVMEKTGQSRIACFHRNVPSMLAKISNMVSDAGLNIENMINKSKGDYAYTIVDVDNSKIHDIVDNLKHTENILHVETY